MKTSLKASLIITVLIGIVALAATLGAGWSPKLGLDLAGGFSATLGPAPKTHPSTADLNTAINIMRERIDAQGVSGATINLQGGNIVVQVPGLANRDQLLNTLQSTAALYFRPALCLVGPYTPPKATKTDPHPTLSPLPSSCPTSSSQLTPANLGTSSESGTNINATTIPNPDTALDVYPPTSNVADDASKPVLLPISSTAGGFSSADRMLLGPSPVGGKQISSASATFSGNAWVVQLSFKDGGSAWDKLATQQYQAFIGIDLDATVISAPITQATSFNNQIQISGGFSEAQAKNLATQLEFGALPVKFNPKGPLQDEVVSPTLGKTYLKAGLWAGMGGLLLVLIYTILYYRALGIVVLAGLALTAALLFAIVSGLSHTSLDLTLDLAGVTGLIVSIGITVDSYIVYFERLKDDVRAGRSVRSSVDRSFKGAFRTVLAADAVSFLAALVLWIFAVGEVKGFAFFLGLSTLLDLFMTYFFTKPLVIWLGRSKLVTEAPIIGVARGLAQTAQT